MAQFALRWILMNDAISVVIPGAKNVEQARANLGGAALAPLPTDTMARIRSIYEFEHQALRSPAMVKASG